MSTKNTLLAGALVLGEACAPTACELSSAGEKAAHSVYDMQDVEDECDNVGGKAKVICVETGEGSASISEVSCDALTTSYDLNSRTTGDEATGTEVTQDKMDQGADCWVTPLSSEKFLVCDTNYENATNTTKISK